MPRRNGKLSRDRPALWLPYMMMVMITVAANPHKSRLKMSGMAASNLTITHCPRAASWPRPGCIDQPDVGVGLRKVADRRTGPGIDLLAVESYIIGVAEQVLEAAPRVLNAVRSSEIVHLHAILP